MVRRHTENLDAHNAYLKGIHYWNALTPEGYLRSRECFEEATRIDPDYARVYVGLALWYLTQSWWGELAPDEGLAAALPLTERALGLDDTIYDVHSFLGIAHGFFEHNWAAAEKSLVKGVELGPGAADAHGNYGAFLVARGRYDEALAEVRLAHKLDPLSPTYSAWTCSWTAYAGEVSEGIAGLERVVAMHPHYWIPHHELSVLYSQGSRVGEAKAEAGKAVELSGGVSQAVARLACACYQLGDATRGNESFEKLQQRARASYVPPTFLAQIHLARGETDAALERLQEAARRKDPWLAFHLPYARPLHARDPRVDAVIASIGLQP